MAKMIIRVFAFIGIFYAVFIPWLVGTVLILSVICERVKETMQREDDRG